MICRSCEDAISAFFEKKLGKKLPCTVVALKTVLKIYMYYKGLPPCKKAFAELFSKSDNASSAALTNHNLKIHIKKHMGAESG